MKRKLLCALAAVALTTLMHTAALCVGEVTISWTQAASVCYVSDVYYYTDAGQKAFIAGGLTEIPAGAEVYMTLRPHQPDDGSTQLLTDVCIELSGSRIYPTREDSQQDSYGGGVFRFTMPESGAQEASLSVNCVSAYCICGGEGIEFIDGAFRGECGTVRVFDVKGMPTACAAAGDELTLTVEPDAASALAKDSLTLTAESGADIALLRGTDGVYRFVMPAEPVTLNASFTDAAPIVLPEYVSCTVSGEYAYSEPYRALPGSAVALSITPLDAGKRIRLGSQAVEPADACTGAPDVDGVSGAFSCNVIMPEGGLTIRADVNALCNVLHDASIELLAEDRITPVTACCAGDVLYASLRVPSGYGLLNGALTITAADGKQTVAQRTVDSDDSSVTCVSIVAPACDMSISADLRPLRSIGNLQPQGLGVIQTYPARSAAVGSKVTVALLPAEGWQVREGSLAICAAGSRTVVAQAENDCFAMPDCDCEISAEFVPVPHEVQLPYGGCFDVELRYTLNASGAVDAPATGGIPSGALVRVEAVPHAGCSARALYMARMDGGGVRELAAGTQAEFIMPDCGVAIYALCSDESHAGPDLSSIPMPVDESGGESAENGGLTSSMLPCGASVYTTDSLRLRSDCHAASDVVDKYANGTRVTMEELSADGEWARVTVDGDGKRGWMKTEYLIPDADVQSPQISITIRLPELRVNRPYLVEQERANESGGYVFKHILLL